MNKVDIYVNGFRLDIFEDEEISINLSVQNVQDISKVFTDFTQGFTVPASAANNAIFQHYYRSDIDSSELTQNTLLNGESLFLSYKFRVLKDGGIVEAGGCCADALDDLGGSYVSTSSAVTFDGRLRQEARIEINSLPFRAGVIELENVQLKGTEPYAYTITFYGDVVTLTDLFGEDYLYDLNFSAYDHEYTDEAVFDRLTTDIYAPLFYPLCSPVKNWIYDSTSANHDDTNIAFHNANEQHGIHYYELKPALKVTAILDAMEAKYGITFTGAFLSATPFVDLSLWLHRFEGYLFAAGNDIAYQLINMNRNTGSGSQFDLATDTWTPLNVTSPYQVNVTIQNASEPYELALFLNGVFQQSILIASHPASSVTSIFPFISVDGPSTLGLTATVQLFIRPQQPTAMTYQCTDYKATNISTSVVAFEVDQTASVSYTFSVVVSDIMPEIKVKDFLAGILKMYNMVIVPTTSTSFLLQPLEDWYAAGSDKDYQDYLDITEYTVNRPPLYREIEFKYQDTEQILGFQYLQTNQVGYGDLNVDFTFDGDEFLIELPFECPLFERLTDQRDDSLTNVLVYKSITRDTDEAGTLNPYLGAPILFYGYFNDYDLSANSVAFVNADNDTSEEVIVAWYANTSNRYQSAATSNAITFGADIDPYHLQSVNQSLYNNEWSNYITDLYAKSRRVYNVEAVLPIGKIITLNLQNAIIWNNAKYIINNVSLNMTTGKATFELLNVV
jgi:hypothetical protein